MSYTADKCLHYLPSLVGCRVSRTAQAPYPLHRVSILSSFMNAGDDDEAGGEIWQFRLRSYT